MANLLVLVYFESVKNGGITLPSCREGGWVITWSDSPGGHKHIQACSLFLPRAKQQRKEAALRQV